MLACFRTLFGTLPLVSILCLAAVSHTPATPLSVAPRVVASPTDEALAAAAGPATFVSHIGIPDTRPAQPLAAPLDVVFVDPMHGWSRDGTQRTTDGGQIWLPAHALGSQIAAFVSPTEGWAGGNTWIDDMCHEVIDHTTDGGRTWSRQYTVEPIAWAPCGVRRLNFVDNLYGWAFGYNLTAGDWTLKTTDGGVTWRSTGLGYGTWLKMLDRTRWFRINTPYRLSITTDGGNTWTAGGRLPGWALLPASMTDFSKSGPYVAPDGKFMVVVGQTGQIARSTDGGATWVDVPSSPVTNDLSWVALADSTFGWAAGADGAVLHTSDGGLTWARQQISTTTGVAWLAAFSPNDALLSADRLYRTADGGAHWTPLPTGIIEAWQAGARPTMDGDLREWEAVPAAHLDRSTAASITGSETDPSPADLNADLRSAWRPYLLYFAVAITDDVLVGNQSGKPWNDDAVEISIYVPPKTAAEQAKTHQFTIGLDGRQYQNGSAITSLAVVTRTVPGGWTLEASIPSWVFGRDALAAGEKYPLTFALRDDDTRGNPAQTYMIWWGTVTDSYQPAWGTLSLSSTVYDFPTGATQTPAPTATATATQTLTPTATPTTTSAATSTPTPTLAPTATSTGTPTETPTQTPTSIPTATPTPTATPPGDMTLTGLIYDASSDAQHPIPYAIVAVTVCVPRNFSATAGMDGRYTLFLPAAYLHGCAQVTLSARAAGYRAFSQTVVTADLRAAPQRDIGLLPLEREWLPLMIR
jgi:photosystem II stability/assembly factor-like uncharacterized protein